jgi:transcription elongation factor Elf1
MDVQERLEKYAAITMGELRPQIVCQLCGERGQVRTKQVKRKTGVHGGKATAALLTGGLSMLATGLSGKQMVTEATCGSCESKYQF